MCTLWYNVYVMLHVYVIDEYVWDIVDTTGAMVKGGYGHSSVYDASTGLVYVHGGYHSGSASSYALSDSMYAFNPRSKSW